MTERQRRSAIIGIAACAVAVAIACAQAVAGSRSIELYHDDGSAEAGFTSSAGTALSVGFQAPQGSEYILGARIYAPYEYFTRVNDAQDRANLVRVRADARALQDGDYQEGLAAWLEERFEAAGLGGGTSDTQYDLVVSNTGNFDMLLSILLLMSGLLALVGGSGADRDAGPERVGAHARDRRPAGAWRVKRGGEQGGVVRGHRRRPDELGARRFAGDPLRRCADQRHQRGLVAG